MRILILGGYGQFGGRISRTLAADDRFDILVAGRDIERARTFIDTSGAGRRAMRPLRLDAGDAAALARSFEQSRPDLVIHTAGPFQEQNCTPDGYRVARAALQAGAHYVDLADARGFVAGFDSLDAEAKAAGRRAISGASSVPGLSAAVIEAHLHRFTRLDAVEAGISPGNRTPRGLATTRAILGYVGRPYPVLLDGERRRVHGWQSLRRLQWPGVGPRWFARCEVPDLDVLPARYPTLKHCDFRAGLELRRMHFGLWLGSWAVRLRLVPSLQPWARLLLRLSEQWLDTGSDVGLMHVDMHGVGAGGEPLALRWQMILRDGDGPQVPCTAAVVLARKLARGELPGAGAGPCLDLFTLEEYLSALHGFAVDTRTVVLGHQAGSSQPS
ncbi:saccharopine dehydrogenase family protein [Marilutibacter chinensis]|uniref:Saccharopine dehydrogenase NADP-binding domain-containing protein n=1 Tax=Marilutibacter chinensis TaxID=2912247 RepID=A0ABS9HUG6_9GAMM|nr:saccharopine dehydrogenase NADP-binding domain-containing protein [Lysobacter chinensis]MCF7222027.1 saccharopine dehydrogenase NADP-binding domain-containing protein [Lysobacter chinensis]